MSHQVVPLPSGFNASMAKPRPSESWEKRGFSRPLHDKGSLFSGCLWWNIDNHRKKWTMFELVLRQTASGRQRRFPFSGRATGSACSSIFMGGIFRPSSEGIFDYRVTTFKRCWKDNCKCLNEFSVTLQNPLKCSSGIRKRDLNIKFYNVLGCVRC